MRFQQNVTVVGMKASKGKLDSGQEYDSTKAYVLTPMDAGKGDSIGSSVTEYKIGDSKAFDAFRGQATPFQAVADFEIVHGKLAPKVVCHGIQRVQTQNKA